MPKKKPAAKKGKSTPKKKGSSKKVAAAKPVEEVKIEAPPVQSGPTAANSIYCET